MPRPIVIGLLRTLALSVTLTLPAVALAEASNATLQRIQRLERALENKGLLDLVRQVELLQAEVRQLRGELENQIFALEQQRKAQRNAYVDVDRRLGTLERSGVAAIPPTGVVPGSALPQLGAAAVDPPLPTLSAPSLDNSIAGLPAEQTIAVDPVPNNAGLAVIPSQSELPPPPVATPGGATSTGVDVVVRSPGGIPPVAAPTIDSAASEAAYREAFGMLKAGQYDDSIAAFDTYLQQYPASQYADNAQYWLGEAYYVKRQFEAAIEQYEKLIKNYPASKKQSHAMLKIAYSYDELGMPEQAMSVLSTLKSNFPGTAAARLADERIQRLRAAVP